MKNMWWWNCIFIAYALLILHSSQPCDSLENYKRNQLAVISARDGKGWGETSTFFDIALTALAFLSFGIFLLNLLCNALMYPTLGSTALTNPVAGDIVTMTGGNGGGGGTTTGGPLITGATGLGRLTIRRRRPGRSVFNPSVDPLTSEEFLISFVSNSIEAMSRKHECLPKVLCEGNRQSKLSNDLYKFLVSAISVTIACTGLFLNLYDDLPWHLNGILLGLKESNCQSHYPSC